jgi:hypothetical protein
MRQAILRNVAASNADVSDPAAFSEAPPVAVISSSPFPALRRDSRESASPVN